MQSKTSCLGTLATAIAVILLATSVEAQLVPPSKAKQLKLDMVTAYNQCVAPTLTHRPSLAFPACVPARSSANDPTNDYSFGPKGKMTVQISVAKGDVKLNVKGSDIWKNGAPYSGSTGLTGSAVLRITDNGCGVAFDVDCTGVDFSLPVVLTCSSGKCSTSAATVNQMFPGAFNAGDNANIEISQIEIIDEDGDDVFRMGILVP